MKGKIGDGSWLAGRSSRTPLRLTAKTWLVAGAATVATASTALALSISINSGVFIQYGQGGASIADCSNIPVVVITPALADGYDVVGQVAVEEIPIGCQGKYLALELRDEFGDVLDRIVWQVALVSMSDTSIRVVADGTRTSEDNSSVGGVSTIYPASELGPAGLTTVAINPVAIASFSLNASSEVVSEW